MATKITYTCDYCGKDMKYQGVPLTITITTSCPYMSKAWLEVCDPCAEHIAQEIEKAIKNLGDNAA